MARNIGANYSVAARTRFSSSASKKVAFIFSLLLAVVFMSSSLLSLASSHPLTALAEGEDTVFQDSAKNYGVDGTDEGFEKAIDKVNSGEIDENTFGFVLNRLLSLSYINKTNLGVAAGNLGTRPYNCNVNAPGKGTPMYHNCDVPNMFTEFLQTVTSSFIASGPTGATAEDAKVTFGLGIPSTIPGKTVPVKAEERTVKYTALELFGYNVKFTDYQGEWDNIKVMNSARALSNFGMIDKLKLSATSVVNGVIAGVQQSASQSITNLSQGNIIGAVSGFFTGFFEGAVAGGTKVILDSSDLNVFNTYAWYRVGYGNTLYRARELSQPEISARIEAQFLSLFADDLSNASVPADYLRIKNGPPRPIESVSKCVATVKKTDAEGVETVTQEEIKSDMANGISQDDCKEQANLLYEDTAPVWTVDGNVKGETLAAWKEKNNSLFVTADSYGLQCTIDSNEANRKTNLDNFFACWDGAWEAERKSILADEQAKLNQEWYDEKRGAKNAYEHFAANPKNNFNAPWNRFVCTYADGKDVTKADGSPEMLYNSDGTLNKANGCVAPRPPIQNGYYGNGYDPKQSNQNPAIDTRRELLKELTIADIFFNPSALTGSSSTIGNMGLGIAKFTTQLTNAVIDLSFTPILQKLGLQTAIISLMDGFKDSVYYPFAGLVIAIGGIVVLIQAGRNKAYTQGITSALLIVGTFMMGVFIINSPKTLLTLVEDVPSQIETVILGTVFGGGLDGNDELCTASQIAVTDIKGLDGNAFTFSPRSATRTLECEIWRVFVFNPYVQGQWGTSYDQLNAENSGRPGRFTNTNTNLVGGAIVNMGGGTLERNWALYQLDVLSKGTSTDQDLTDKNAGVPRDFYRIVDAQAGPNNGAGTDSRFFGAWSGDAYGARTVVGVLSAVVAIVGFIAIFGFAIVKIEVTLLLTFMLLFLPFILLIGIIPGFGRTRLKKYAGTMIALTVQRVVMVTMLAVLLKILTGVALAGGSYPLIALISLAICGLFIAYRKEVIRMVTTTSSSAVGGVMGEEYVNNPGSAFSKAMPLSMRNSVANTKFAVTGATGGAIAGFIDGGPRGAAKSVKQSFDINMNRSRRSQRRTGIGAVTKIMDSAEAGRSAAGKSVQGNKELQTLKKDLQKKMTARNAEENGSSDWINIDLDHKPNLKDMEELTSLKARIEKLENSESVEVDKKGKLKEPKPVDYEFINKKELDPEDIQKLEQEQDQAEWNNNERQWILNDLRNQESQIEEQLYARNNTDISYEQHKAQYESGNNSDSYLDDDDENRYMRDQSKIERMRDETFRMRKQLEEARSEAWKAVKPKWKLDAPQQIEEDGE